MTLTWVPTFAPPYAAAPPAVEARVNPLVRLALFLFIVSIPFEIPNRAIPIEVPTITGFLLFATTLLNPSVCYGRAPAAVRWFVVFLWIYAAIVLVHRVDALSDAARLFLNLALLVMVFWATANLLARDEIRRGALFAWVLACTVRASMQVTGILATEHPQWGGGVRVTVLGQNENLSAIILSAGLVAVIGMGGRRQAGLPHLRLLAPLLAVLMGTAMIETGSRGGLVGAAVGMLVYLLRGPTVAARVRQFVFGVAAMAVLGWGAWNSDTMRSRLTAADEGDWSERQYIYPALADMVMEKPIFGWGPIDNQFELERRLQERWRIKRDAHNLVLELLTATGLAGAVPFLIGVALCVRDGFRGRRTASGAVCLALLLAVLTGQVTGTWIAAKVVWLALAFAVGAGAAAQAAGSAPVAVAEVPA